MDQATVRLKTPSTEKHVDITETVLCKMGRDLRATVEETQRDRQPSRRRRQNADGLDRRHIEEAIAKVGLPDLVVPVKEPHRQLLVDFAVLNRMRVASLWNDLAAKVQEIDNGAKESSYDILSSIDGLLERYCKTLPLSSISTGADHRNPLGIAIRDWELMEKYSARANGKHEKDPFFISTRSFLQQKILRGANLLDRKDYIAKDEDQPELPLSSRPGLRMLGDTEEFVTRFAFAIFGRLSLVGPMVLMVLRKDILTSLLTVSVSVLLFAFVVSLWAVEASPSVVMSLVTAYAGASSG